MTFRSTTHWLAALLLTLITATANAEDTADAKASSEAVDAMMKIMQERTHQAVALGEHHQALARFIGDWDVELALVMPGMAPQSSPGTATYSWLIEGRWLGQRLSGTMMGMPYESFALIGYDTFAKNHVTAWISSADNALNIARGVVVDPTGKTTATYGTLDEYTTGELGKPIKVVTRVKDENHHVVEVWDLGIGTEGAKVIEFRYARKKG